MTKKHPEIERKREIVTMTVVEQDSWQRDGQIEFGDGYEDGSLARFIASLERVKAKVPKAYREKARCKLEGMYDSSGVMITISYERPETDAEVKQRLMTEAADDLARLNADKALYERLAKKFGSKTDG